MALQQKNQHRASSYNAYVGAQDMALVQMGEL